ncbi:nitroreductase/quinone reductase family protein [Isoptericola sp. NPDC056618]|uniref:nitroreductase/quinone reductase family protein n=1 Tax=Isoptericola sp. NPDC056618 TaxID=3345878 RepID=UPI0036C5958D
MSFTHPQGTRGAHQPRGRFLAGRNRRVARRAGRSTGDLLALTTIGRRTGQERSAPVGGFPGGNGSWIVVASAAGARANPSWYLNLAAHPDRATVTTGGRTVPVVAEELHGVERAAAWRTVTSVSPAFARYQDRTDRELPVIRLTPRA